MWLKKISFFLILPCCFFAEESVEFYCSEAKRLFAEQKHFEAQAMFLCAIEKITPQSEKIASVEEQEYFSSAYAVYSEAFGSQELTSAFLQSVQQVIQTHPDWMLVRFYAAAAAANLGHLDQFFDDFLHAYTHHHHCYMADKGLGVLHLRLYEASLQEEERKLHRAAATAYLKNAFAKNPADSLLFLKLLYILPEEEKRPVLDHMVDVLLKNDVAIRRSDCCYIIEQLFSYGLKDKAVALFIEAKRWYGYSRFLQQVSEKFGLDEESVRKPSDR